MSQAVRSRVQQSPRAQVIDQGNLGLLCQLDQLRQTGLRREPDEAEIGVMGAQNDAGSLAQGPFVVAQMGAVGRADLNQLCARLVEHFWYPETASDLDQLGARDDRLPAVGKGGQGKQDGRRVVVDDEGRFGACQLSQERFGVGVAVSALAGRQIVFERAVLGLGGDGQHRLARGGAQGRPTQVGVQDDAGGVDHRAQTALEPAIDDLGGLRDQLVVARPGPAVLDALAGGLQRLPDGRQREGSPELADHALAGFAANEPIDRGQLSQSHKPDLRTLPSKLRSNHSMAARPPASSRAKGRLRLRLIWSQAQRPA